MCCISLIPSYSLIVENDVWPPDALGRHMHHVNALILADIPGQVGIIPGLEEQRHTVRDHYLTQLVIIT